MRVNDLWLRLGQTFEMFKVSKTQRLHENDRKYLKL